MTDPMPHHPRLRISLLSTLPVLAVAALLLPPLALAGLLPWSLLPTVVLAQGVQAWLVFRRLGRAPATP
ncbi:MULTISPECIES: hypothetical protein [Kitasatospora]|uniref:Uncharacterized protein n=1 Tax=Kitasatospora cathayae TaxID=3004092 RepID=A0ABY7QEH1_9ACTN|nr:hypothetical protein [Kitasatospora sp. HUAS 3-15]WBP91027.1 hypothetical protein O1G21_37610 [Kitasatospora sp. HUAS 3-15]